MELLPEFSQLREQELWAQTLHLAYVNNSKSEAARKIMRRLHFDKHGVLFNLITIHVWTTAMKYLSVLSHLNSQGDYVQWEEDETKT
jgi:hypothetical protein